MRWRDRGAGWVWVVAMATLGCGGGGGGGEPDRTPPLPVEGFVVTASGGDVHGSWTLPGAPGAPEIAGVVVVRLTGLPEAPVHGTEYAVGEQALGGEIVLVGDATAFDDPGRPAGDASYAVFSHTSNLTYGPLASAAARLPLPAHTATLVIDLASETVTATTSGGLLDLDAELHFATGDTSGEVYVRLTNLSNGVLFNPKLAMSSVTDQLDADRTLDLTGVEGTLPDGHPYLYFGPQALAVGRTTAPERLGFTNVDATTVLTIEVELRHGPMLIAGEVWNNDPTDVLPLFDIEAETQAGSLRGAPFGPRGVARPVGGYLSPDGRFLYMGSRNVPEVTVYDLTTLYPTAILPIVGEHGRGSVPVLRASAGGGTLYALFLDGAHTYRKSDGTPPDGYTTPVHVELVRIDRASLTETGRVRLQTLPPASDTGVRGRRMAISPNGQLLAIPVLSHRDRRGVDATATEASGAIHFVDLARFVEVDTDPDVDGVQPLAMGNLPVDGGGTGTGNPTVVEWVNDGLLLAGNTTDDPDPPNDSVTVATGGFIEVTITGAGEFDATLYSADDTHVVELFRDAAGVVHVGGRGSFSLGWGSMTFLAKTYDPAAHALVEVAPALPAARVMIAGPTPDRFWVQDLEGYNDFFLVDFGTSSIVTTLTSARGPTGHWIAVTPF